MNFVIKTYYTQPDVDKLIQNILMQMQRDNWKPDYIVGLTRGGLIPAVYISHYLAVPMHTLKVSLRDGPGQNESNTWMAEDASGYAETLNGIPIYNESIQKRILIVDDINDTGATLDWIMQDWETSCMPTSLDWKDVWGNNVRFATLVDNLSSDFKGKISYTGTEINKAEKDSWVVFPWER